MSQRGHTPTQARGNPQQSSNCHALSDEATPLDNRSAPLTSESEKWREVGWRKCREREARRKRRHGGDKTRNITCRKL